MRSAEEKAASARVPVINCGAGAAQRGRGGIGQLAHDGPAFPFISVFRLEQKSQAAADGFGPDLGPQGGEMAVADRSLIEQTTRGVLAALFALNQQAEMGVDEGFGGIEEIDGTGIRELEIMPG